MNSYYRKLKERGYIYHNKSLIKEETIYFQEIVKKYFPKDVKYYNSLNAEKFRRIALLARNEIQSSMEIVRAKKKIINFFKKTFRTKDDYLASSYFAFFPARNLKNSNKKAEQLDLHRETFYAGDKKPYHAHQYNVWLPIFDIEKNQNLNYVEKSHLIKDKDIKIVNVGAKKKEKLLHTL